MFKNKKFILGGLVILIILIIIIIVLFVKKEGNNSAEENNRLNIDAARAQTYATPPKPSLASDDKIFGSAQAALKIFVYEDYADLYSSRLADTLDQLRLENGDQLAIIVRPYISATNNLSAPAAEAVACAGEQEKWKEMRALLFAQVKAGHLALANFGSYGEQIGLKLNDFGTCLTKNQKSEKIEQLTAAPKEYGVIGAPTMFVGSEIILGARPYENFTDSNGDKIEGLKTVVERLLK